MIDPDRADEYQDIAARWNLPWESIGCHCGTCANALYKFAESVAEAAIAAEREACAKVCDDYCRETRSTYPDSYARPYVAAGASCAAAIRARAGQQQEGGRS